MVPVAPVVPVVLVVLVVLATSKWVIVVDLFLG